jgi:hypothetical protein
MQVEDSRKGNLKDWESFSRNKRKKKRKNKRSRKKTY